MRLPFNFRRHLGHWRRHHHADEEAGKQRPSGDPFPKPSPATLMIAVLLLFFAALLLTRVPSQGLGGAGRLAVEEGQGSAPARVSRRSHAYLQPAFWNRTAASFTANVGAEYELAAAAARDQESFYKPWIEKYLEPWKEDGITEEILDSAAALHEVPQCSREVMRVQILSGSLWVQHLTERQRGWDPATLGPGNVAAKGRVPYTLLALMQTLCAFPGQIPDLDAVFMLGDFPCMRKKWAHGDVPPPPLFGYQGSVRHYDIPFPDYTFWGHEYHYLQDLWGSPAHGWAGQAEILARKYENVSLLDRIPQAMWRGRTWDKAHPDRDRLRRKFVGCLETVKRHPESLKAGRGRKIEAQEAALLNVGPKPPVALQDTCDYRYPVYIEADSYASNLKTKLACGSVVVVLQMEYWDWYAPALQAGKHYVEVTREEDHVCEEIIPKLKDMNAAFDTRGGSVLRTSGQLTPTLEAQLASLRKDKAMKSLLDMYGALRATDPPVADSAGNYSWGSSLYPWDIAAEGQRFVREHLRMEDTLLYMRDLLKAYAALQRFPVKPAAKARCYTGDLVLEQFGTPYKVDGEIVERAYPWLRGYDGGCPAAEEVWGGT